MNNRGFSVLELSISLFVGISLLYVIIFIPTQILKNYVSMSSRSQVTKDAILMTRQIHSDISTGLNVFMMDDQLFIGDDVSYSFINNKLIRKKGSEHKILSESVASFEIFDDVLSITLRDFNNVNNSVTFDYNLDYVLTGVGVN